MNRSIDRVMAYFEKISSIPRCSKDETRVAAWIKQWADENQFAWKSDTAGNLVIQVPGRGASDQAPPIILQGHMDMVCEKTPDSPHDFKKDPLTLITVGEWLHADRTTLGADNGIALALAMAAATDTGLVHPPLELLFTVDEETGLTGAEKLGPDMLSGKVLINMDSEIEGTFIVGCAGGQDMEVSMTVKPEEVHPPMACWEITVGGLHGGHSGVDIHRNRANANLVLADTLKVLGKVAPLQLRSFIGGSAHNAIPRDARALVIAPRDGAQALEEQLAACRAGWQAAFAHTDANLEIKLQAVTSPAFDKALNLSETQKVLALILAMPHGVAGLSNIWQGVVETSGNLARVQLEGDRLTLMCSLRSSDESRLDEIAARVSAVAHLAGAQTCVVKRYPAWEVDLDSDLLARCRKRYSALFSEEANVEVMHAGLECGVIGAKFAGMEMISIGPTLEHPHSPQERLHLPAVGKVWDFLEALLKDYAA
jgi:dipeptidase D